MSNEPVMTAASVLAVIAAVATALGLHVSSGTEQALATVVAFALPLVIGVFTRSKVTPVAKP